MISLIYTYCDIRFGKCQGICYLWWKSAYSSIFWCSSFSGGGLLLSFPIFSFTTLFYISRPFFPFLLFFFLFIQSNHEYGGHQYCTYSDFKLPRLTWPKEMLFSWLSCFKADILCLQETQSISKDEFAVWVKSESDSNNNPQQISVSSVISWFKPKPERCYTLSTFVYN